jgi:glycosyltransferase involved in cell wall biosynthesis
MRVAMLLHKSVEYDSRVRREARTLVAAGHDVTVVELDPGASGSMDGFTRVSASPPAWVRRALPFQLYRVVFLGSFLLRLLRLRPDVVHAHDAAMLLPGLLGARLGRARLVYDSHELATGVPYRDGRWAAFVRVIERIAVPRAAAVITVTDGIADRLQALYGLGRRPAVVRNVTELDPPAGPTGALRARLGLDSEPLVLHQGAPAPDRGGEQLIAAMAELPDAHLVFLGSSPFSGYEDGLRAQAAAAALADRVHFLPSVPLDRLLEHTADADVGVSLLQDTCENHRLALPNKVFEYVAAGVPVVVSALPELTRLVEEHGIGWTVPAADPRALAERLRTALAEGGDAEHLARAAEALSWAREQARLLELYDGLRSRRALVLVRNPVTHDARVNREAATLAASGFEPVVLGVVSTHVTGRRGTAGGAPLLRLAPRSPLGRLRDRVRAEPAIPDPPAPAGGTAPSAPSAGRRLGLRLHRALTAADFYRQGIGAVRALRPALLHCNDWNTMWIGVAAKLTRGTHVVYDSHELWADRNGRPELRPWLLAAEALFVRAADEVVTTSPGYADELARRYRVALPTLVRNLPAGGSADAGTPTIPPTLVYVGGLLRGRGLEQAIAALALVPQLHCSLIGPVAEPYRAELLSLAQRAGVADRVSLRGPVPPEEVVAALAGAAMGLCLIQPICRSYELTLPNKLYEYAAAGVPILASDLPVIASTVRQWDAGEVVPPSDPAAIAAGMTRLLDPGRGSRCRDGARAMAAASRWEGEREVLAGVYRRVTGEPNSSRYSER